MLCMWQSLLLHPQTDKGLELLKRKGSLSLCLSRMYASLYFQFEVIPSLLQYRQEGFSSIHVDRQVEDEEESE